MLTSALLFAGLALAANDASTNPYVAPGKGDSRSPCPGLNTLANHGFLPHDGRNLALEDFQAALKNGLNVGIDVSSLLAAVGLQAAQHPTVPETIDLEELREHNFPIEHDGSLSRMDAYYGNDYSFNQDAWNEVLSYFHTPTIDLKSASAARWHRIKNCLDNNPDCLYSARELIISYGETAFYLAALGDADKGEAPVDFVKMFFEQEKLPYSLGWEKPTEEITLNTLNGLILKLVAANGAEIIPEGLTVGIDALRDVLSLIDPITGKAINATCAAAGTC